MTDDTRDRYITVNEVKDFLEVTGVNTYAILIGWKSNVVQKLRAMAIGVYIEEQRMIHCMLKNAVGKPFQCTLKGSVCIAPSYMQTKASSYAAFSTFYACVLIG